MLRLPAYVESSSVLVSNFRSDFFRMPAPAWLLLMDFIGVVCLVIKFLGLEEPRTV